MSLNDDEPGEFLTALRALPAIAPDERDGIRPAVGNEGLPCEVNDHLRPAKAAPGGCIGDIAQAPVGFDHLVTGGAELGDEMPPDEARSARARMLVNEKACFMPGNSSMARM